MAAGRDHRKSAREGAGGKGRMTWERLANDPSISKAELPRIAKAFGLSKPKAKAATPRRASAELGATSKKKVTTRPKAKATTTRRKWEGTQDAGPEGVYRKRIKARTSPGGKAGRKGTTFTKVKPTQAARARTGGRGRLTESGKLTERLRKSRGGRK